MSLFQVSRQPMSNTAWAASSIFRHDLGSTVWAVAGQSQKPPGRNDKGRRRQICKFFGRVTDLCTMQQGDDAVALRVERRTSDREVVGLTPARALLAQQPRQVVHTLVHLSSSSISWYQCKNWEDNGRLWKRCGLPSITLSVSLLLA